MSNRDGQGSVPATLKTHNFVRNEWRTDYSHLNNQQYSIYCTNCGYVAFDTHSDYNNDKRQANLPQECGARGADTSAHPKKGTMRLV